MAFLDEDELAPAERSGYRRGGADRQRQFLLRRVIALGVGVLILILILLAIRGCLSARKERGFENYASDLSSIAAESSQLSQEFFGRLTDPPQNLDELTLEAQVGSDRGTAQSLLQRVEGLDTPDELAGAQDELALAFALRRDALAGIAANISTALGEQGRDEALEQIASDMRTLLASDVLYARARAEIQAVLADEGIGGEVASAPFLPEPNEEWLDELALSATLSTVASDAGAVRGVHGVALIGTTVQPGDVVLAPETENTVRLRDDLTLNVEVENGGETEERDVIVQFELTGPGTQIGGQTTVDIDAGGVATAELPIGESPEPGVPLGLEVRALSVPGETIVDNNVANYTVAFED